MPPGAFYGGIMAQIRLDKLLANRTQHSRSDVKALLKQGAVQIDGITECDGSRKVDPDTQRITCAGKALPGGAHTFFLVNKPEGYLCATEDRTHRTVLELLPAEKCVKGLFPAGRLDADSTGLVLLTDDGALAHRMLAPKRHVPKYYLVQLARRPEPDYAARLAQGLTLADGTVCMPAEMRVLEQKGFFVLVRLHEGKYHQVKRMFAALGNHVQHLHRVAVGGLLLPPALPLGGYMEIVHKDVETLLKDDGFDAVCEQIVKTFSSYLINEGQ